MRARTAADGRGEPPDADEPDEQRQEGEQRVEQRRSGRTRGSLRGRRVRTPSAAAAVVPSPIERHPAPNERMRSVADEGSGASCPIAGTPCVISSRLPNSRKAMATAQASRRGAPRPGQRGFRRRVRPTAAAAANRSSEAGRRMTARTCALPLVCSRRTSLSGTRRMRSRYRAPPADLAVVREVPRPCADRVLRSPGMAGEQGREGRQRS